jgi:hypothetical protein
MMDSRLHLRVIASRDRAPLRLDPARDRLPHRRRRFRPVPAATDEVGAVALTVRVASRDDLRALWRLAELDSALVPPPPVLIAEAADGPVAALSLADGSVIADPFTPTVHLVELLRLRARQLRAEGERPPRAGRRFPARLLGRMTRESDLAPSAPSRNP